jgi:hypothetical protein
LIVSDTAAALADAGINLNSRASPPRAHEIAVPSQNERWDLREPRGFDCQFFVVAIALWIVLGLGFGGLGLYRFLDQSDDLSGTTAVSALVERIIAVESNGDPNAKNSRSSATGLGHFLEKPGLIWCERIARIWPEGTAQGKHSTCDASRNSLVKSSCVMSNEMLRR